MGKTSPKPLVEYRIEDENVIHIHAFIPNPLTGKRNQLLSASRDSQMGKDTKGLLSRFEQTERILTDYSHKSTATDHLEYMPKFRSSSPSVLYVTHAKPAQIQCIATPAITVFVTCVDRFQVPPEPINHHRTGGRTRTRFSNSMQQRHAFSSNTADETTNTNGLASPQGQKVKITWTKIGPQTIQANRTIQWQTLVGWSDGTFWCRCEAWNNVPDLGEPRVKVTNKTVIKMAHIAKRFVRNPKSTQVLHGWSVELTCQAPEGIPRPKVFWVKDGKRLKKPVPDRYQLLEEWHSAPTRTVHPRDPPTNRRTIPNNRPNLNRWWSSSVGETWMPSELEDRRIRVNRLIINSTHADDAGTFSCLAVNIAGHSSSSDARLSIQVDGQWSPWTPWTKCPSECLPIRKVKSHNPEALVESFKCSPNCASHLTNRRRACNAPEPQSGGRSCVGGSREQLSCLILCQNHLSSSSSSVNQTRHAANHRGAARLTPREIGLLFFLACSILTFLGATMSVIYLIVRRRCGKGNQTTNITSLIDHRAGESLKGSEVLWEHGTLALVQCETGSTGRTCEMECLEAIPLGRSCGMELDRVFNGDNVKMVMGIGWRPDSQTMSNSNSHVTSQSSNPYRKHGDFWTRTLPNSTRVCHAGENPISSNCDVTTLPSRHSRDVLHQQRTSDHHHHEIY